MIIENRRDEGVRLYEDISPTMRAAWGTGGGNVPMILDDEIYSMANCDHTLTLSYFDLIRKECCTYTYITNGNGGGIRCQYLLKIKTWY